MISLYELTNELIIVRIVFSLFGLLHQFVCCFVFKIRGVSVRAVYPTKQDVFCCCYVFRQLSNPCYDITFVDLIIVLIIQFVCFLLFVYFLGRSPIYFITYWMLQVYFVFCLFVLWFCCAVCVRSLSLSIFCIFWSDVLNLIIVFYRLLPS